VGTVTEIADYLRLLFARVGIPHCPSCGKRIEAQTVQQIVDRVLALPDGSRFSVLAPIARARKGELKLELERLRREGFVRARVDGAVVDLGDPIELDRSKAHDLDVVVDRIVLKEGVKGRLTDSVELALKTGKGRLLIAVEGEEPFWLSERFACVDCGSRSHRSSHACSPSTGRTALARMRRPRRAYGGRPRPRHRRADAYAS
jgi:excinuclease ABC subunit A